MNFGVSPGGSLQGEITVPGDKSISHRSIMLGALAEGVTEVGGFLDGLDCLATRDAFRAMGVRIEGPDNGRIRIHGVGLHGLKAPSEPLDLGNSGTSMRLIAGILSAQAFDCTLIGDASLSRRPMRRVIEPLGRMGAKVEATAQGTAPLHIHGGQRLRGIHYESPVASAQVKSVVLLAGMYAEGETRVIEPGSSRDHTERMLSAFRYPVQWQSNTASLRGGGRLIGKSLQVPADISSAAFFLVGASIAPGSDLLLRNVGINPTRTGVIEILRRMGASIEYVNQRQLGAEPVADLRVRSRPLHGIHIPKQLVPLAIDEFPALFIAAACAEGVTLLDGAEELRVKESDRIQVMADGLQQLGIKAEPTADGIRIEGGELTGGTVDSQGDHRIAMSFAMAALQASGEIQIRDCRNVGTSFPGFVGAAKQVGLTIEEKRELP